MAHCDALTDSRMDTLTTSAIISHDASNVANIIYRKITPNISIALSNAPSAPRITHPKGCPVFKSILNKYQENNRLNSYEKYH